jgi:uncharacterized repeat protein (TIGR01451 family)
MHTNLSLNLRGGPIRASRALGASTLVLALFVAQAGPAFATIDNTATPSGTPAAGTLPTAPTATVNVPVAAPTAILSLTKAGANPVETGSDGVINAGDTITYTYVITNGGNTTIAAVAPVETLAPTFNSIAGTGTYAPSPTLVSTTNASSTGATLLPGESGTWTWVYTLTAVDAYRAAGIVAATGNAVENTATATGTPPVGVSLAAVTPASTESEIPANPKFAITKTRAFTTDTGTLLSADVGDVIKYTYSVTNVGNVTINSVSVSDNHEGSVLVGQPLGESIAAIDGGNDGPLAPGVTSTDALANNGVWSVLRPGAKVVFTYSHTVTQAEFDNQ